MRFPTACIPGAVVAPSARLIARVFRNDGTTSHAGVRAFGVVRLPVLFSSERCPSCGWQSAGLGSAFSEAER